MRAYFFGNMYLSSLQQGLQAAHVVADMFVKYQFTSCPRVKMLLNWAENHKTIILLNAGYSSEIHSLVEFFNTNDNPYPWAKFHEGEDALDGALTDVGIILPRRIYEVASTVRSGKATIIPASQPKHFLINLDMQYTHSDDLFDLMNDIALNAPLSQWEVDLIHRIGLYGLAK